MLRLLIGNRACSSWARRGLGPMNTRRRDPGFALAPGADGLRQRLIAHPVMAPWCRVAETEAHVRGRDEF